MERNSNIEVLRLILMFFIILGHLFIISIGNIFNNKILFYIELFGLSFVTISVNTFIFISGYFGIKFKIQTLKSLIVQVLFYAIAIYILGVLFCNQGLSIKGIISNIFPISSNIWWFISAYVTLYIFSPIINIGFEKLERKELKLITISLLFLNCFSNFLFENYVFGILGYSVFSFITIYCLARYIRKYNINIRHPLYIYIIGCLVLFLINLIVCRMYNYVYLRALYYTNPLIILSGIGIFFYFYKKVNFKSSFINKMAKYSLAIYLIHTHPFIFPYIQQITSKIYSINNDILIIISLFIFAIAIFVSCLIIESIRVNLFNKLAICLNTFRKSTPK